MSLDIQQPENPAYYAARAVEERRLAMAAADPNARAVHLEMAEKYAQLAADGETGGEQVAGNQQQAS